MERTEANLNIAEKGKEKKKKSWKRFLWKVPLFFAICFLFFSLILGLIFSFNFSKTFILKTALNLVNQEFNGNISFENVHLNVFKGIIFDNILISLNGDTIAFLPIARIDWEIAPLFKKRIFVGFFELERPQIFLVKELNDSLWNIEKFFKPTEKKETKSKTDLIIHISRLRIENGLLKIVDKNHQPSNHRFNPENLIIDNLDISWNGKLDLLNSKFDFNIENLSFIEKHSNLYVTKLTAKVEIDSHSVIANKLVLETPNTKLASNLGYYIQSSKFLLTNVNVQTKTDDILKFVNIPVEKNSKISLSGNVEMGKNLLLKDIVLQIDNSSKLEFNGKVDLENSHPEIEFIISKAKIYEHDVRDLLFSVFKSIPINFGYFATNDFTFGYKNKTLSFLGKFSTSAGDILSNIELDSNLLLDYSISFNKLDLKKIYKKLPKTELKGISNGSLSLMNFTFLNGFISCNIVDGKSEINGIEKFQLTVYSKFQNGLIKVDSLIFSNHSDLEKNQPEEVNFSGNIDISNPKDPSYSGNLSLKNVGIYKFFGNGGNFPQNLTAFFKIEGKGFDINSFLFSLDGRFEELSFEDRSLFPFSLILKINHIDSLDRQIYVKSEVLKGQIRGVYQFNSLIEDFSHQFNAIAESFESKLNTVLKPDTALFLPTSKSLKPDFKELKAGKFYPANFEANFEINDFSLINIILKKNLTFSGGGKVKVEIDENSSDFILDSLSIDYFSFPLTQNNYWFSISNLFVNANYQIGLFEGKPNLNYFSARVSTDNRVILGFSYLDYLDLNLDFKDNCLEVTSSTNLNSFLGVKLRDKILFSDTLIQNQIDILNLTYQNVFQWDLASPFNVDISSQSISIGKLALKRENGEIVNLNGKFNFDGYLDFRGEITSIPLNDFQKLLPKENSLAQIKSFFGKVDRIEFKVQNSLDNPDINLKFLAADIQFENMEIGNILAELFYSDYSLKGKLKLTNKKFMPFEIEINEVPVELNLKELKFGVVKEKGFKAFLNCERFNLSLLGPFISSYIENLQGSVKISTSISGFLPEDLRFYGFLDILESSFVATNNNLKYNLSGRINFEGTEFSLNDIIIRNIREDYRNGNGIISGKIIFSNNRLENVELNLFSEGIKILSSASSKTLPQLYGDLVISTAPAYLRFIYDRNELLLEGNVNLVFGKLYMPGSTGSESVKESFVQYEISNASTQNTSIKAPNNREEPQKTTNLKLDLTLKFIQPIELTLDLTSIGQIYALISLENELSSIRFFSDPKNDITLLTGNDLILREGSTLKFVKLFNTEGKINFPTGAIDNPSLNLVAYYNGQSVYNDAVRNFTVKIYITGTREKPKLRFDYTFDGQPASDDSSKVAQDALFLLAFGKTKSEIEKGGLTSNFNLSEFSTSGSSAILSKIVSDALSGTGFISSADIILPPTASALDRATLKMSGRFLGMTWNFGGTMADLLNNNEMSVEVPIGTVLPFGLPNIILQLSRSSSLTQSFQRNQKDWEIKLKYGSTW